MFTVIADELLYDRRAVGHLLPSIQPTLRDRVEDALYADVEEVRKEHEKVRKEHEKEIETLTDAHGAALEEKDTRIEELEKALEEFRVIVDKIDDGQSLLAQLEESRYEVDSWRKSCVELREGMELRLRATEKPRSKRR
jgi:uncharacterized protein (DUF3084 family)